MNTSLNCRESEKAMEDLKKLVDDDEAEFMYESLENEAALIQVNGTFYATNSK